MSKKPLPKGIRNHNPGNIEYSPSIKWQGAAEPPTDGRFCRFVSAPYGIRALARVLITYQDKRKAKDGSKIDTIREVIERWAPPFENNTGAYATHIAKLLDLDPDDESLDMHKYEHIRPLVEGIIRHENGVQPYTDGEIDKGLALAGITPPEKRLLTESRTVQGSALAVGGSSVAIATGVAQVIEPAMPLLEWVKENGQFGLIILGTIILIGAIYAIWARIDDRNRGLR